MPYDNEFYLASAGAGKTTMMANYAINNHDSQVLLTTYTHENTAHLQKTVCELCGIQPNNITIMSWFSFLLSECIRPYQNFLYDAERIENLTFVPNQSAKYQKRDNIRNYYMADKSHIFSDKLSDFVCRCNEASNGLVIKRLEQLFDIIVLDEAQDVAGYDLEILQILIQSNIRVIMVGDVRQQTYSTNKSLKNKKYSNDKYLWFQELENKNYGKLEILNQSHRCIQAICDFSDQLFPTLPKTKSLNSNMKNHNGIFVVKPTDLERYYSLYKPQILCHDKRSASKAQGLTTSNFGAVKGQTYDHVVIIPTKPIEDYLKSGNPDKVKSIEKFYVAITRARFSVAFITDCQMLIPSIEKWSEVTI